MEGEQGFPQGVVLYLDIRPLNTVSKPPSNGLEKSLLCCEPDGKAFRGPRPLLAPINLFLCKNPTEKEVPPASHQAFNPTNIDDINTCANDHS
jgi:hypothetical protein